MSGIVTAGSCVIQNNDGIIDEHDIYGTCHDESLKIFTPWENIVKELEISDFS